MSDTTLEARDAIALLVSCGGNSALAAAQATEKYGVKITEPLLLAAIASDPGCIEQLNRQLRILTTLQGFQALRLTQMAFVRSLGDMTPKEVARLYPELLSIVGSMSQSAPAPVQDPYRALAGVLPPEVFASVEHFVRKQQSGSTVDLGLEGQFVEEYAGAAHRNGSSHDSGT